MKAAQALRASADRRAPAGHTAKPWTRMQATGDAAHIYLYDAIDSWWGIGAQEFIDALNGITASSITVHINSPGGDVFDGLAIYQALLTHPADITVDIDGLAASAASFIAQAGAEVRIGTSAMVMIHDASGFCWGDATTMRDCAELLDKISDSIADLYATRAGGEATEWRDRMLAETWYTGAEAVDAGLADLVIPEGATKRRPCESGDDDPDDPMCNKAKPSAHIDVKATADVETDAEPIEEREEVDDTTTTSDDDTWGELVAQLVDERDQFASLTKGLLA